MAMPIRAVVPAIVGVGLALAAAASMSNTAASPWKERASGPSACPAATGAVPAPELKDGKSDVDCGLEGRLVTYHGVGVYVPPPGAGVSASADSASGGVSLNVQTSPDGVVTADFEGAEQHAAKPATTSESGTSTVVESAAVAESATVVESAAMVRTASPATTDSACSLTAYRLNGWQWAPGVTAKFLVNTTEARPSNISGATFLSIQRSAAARISSAYNNCGIVVDPSITIASGTTTANSNINGATNTCLAGDRHNVLDFGNLSGTTLALNCAWYQRVSGSTHSRITESDTRFDNSSRAWVTSTSGCTGSRYDLLSVATHEMGHWVGLGHVAEVGRSDLTMSPVITPCSTSARTLGRGDIRGLMIPY